MYIYIYIIYIYNERLGSSAGLAPACAAAAGRVAPAPRLLISRYNCLSV